MSDMKFTEDHEWVRMDADDVGTCGITEYAQDQLGELVFIELPEVGSDCDQGAEVAVIESVKAAGELKSPISGQVVEVNTGLADTPETVNSDPYGDGWFVKVKISDPSELEGLMDEEAYKEYVDSLD